jgi:hypothetical protein
MKIFSLFGQIDTYRLFFFLASAAIFCVSASTTILWENRSGLAIYYLYFSSFALYWSCRSIWAAKKLEAPKPDYWALLFYVIITIIAALTRFKDLATIIPWCDEDWHNMRLLRSTNVVDIAAWIQQPPLHYYFSKFNLLLFKQTPYAIRFFPALFATVSVPLFFSFLLKSCKNKTYAYLGTIAFLSSIWIVSYAKEAKPYSVGIFCFLLFLHAFYDFIKESSWKNWISLTLTGALTLISIGLQPLILVFGALGFYFLHSLLEKDKKQAQKIFFSAFFAGLAFLPFQLNIVIGNNSGLMKKINLEAFFRKDLWSSLQDTITAMQSLLQSGLVIFLFILPLFLLLRILLRATNEQESAIRKTQLFLFQLAHLFPVVFIILYALLVNSPLLERYIILFIPLYISTIAYSFDLFDSYLAKISLGQELKRFPLLLASLLTLTYAYASSDDRSTKPMETKWDQLYKLLKSDDSKGALGFIFTLNLPHTFALDGFINLDFYYSPTLKEKIKLNGQWDVFLRKTQTMQILEKLLDKTNPSHIYFFYYDKETDLDYSKFRYSGDVKVIPITEIPEGVKAVGYWDAKLIKIKNTKGTAETLLTFFTEMEKQIQVPDLKFKAYEVLAGIHAHRKDCQKAKEYMVKLKPCISEEKLRGGKHLLCLNYSWLEFELAKSCGEN